MKKGITFLILFCLICSLTMAQSFTLVPDPIYQISKNQLFRLTILNTSNQSGSLTIYCKVFSPSGKMIISQQLMTSIGASQSKRIDDKSGLKTLFIDTDFQAYYQNGVLPPFDYKICYQAYFASDLNSKSEECQDVLASDFISILPLYPGEEEVLYSQNPFFSWSNMLATDLNKTYNFKLVEKEVGQNAHTALRRNLPIVYQQQLLTTSLDYPVDAPPLKNNEEYAWQIELNLNGKTFARSDAFSFIYKESDEYIEIPRDLSYVDIKRVKQGSQLYAVGEFKFKYQSESESALKLRLFSLKNEKRKELKLEADEILVDKNLNKLKLDLKDQVYLKHKADYLLSIKDISSGKEYSLNIIYINPDYIR